MGAPQDNLGREGKKSQMCGRVIQARGPIEYAIVDGLDVRDSRLSNYPRRWNGAPSQEFLVIRQNLQTGERSLDLLKWGLIPYWCKDPKPSRGSAWHHLTIAYPHPANASRKLKVPWSFAAVNRQEPQARLCVDALDLDGLRVCRWENSTVSMQPNACEWPANYGACLPTLRVNKPSNCARF